MAATIGLACVRSNADYNTFPDPATDLKSHGAGPQKAVLAGGCFWCTEGVFAEIPGVSDVTSVYAGGTAETANYEAVCTGTTDHAEAIQITYDPAKVSYGKLLKLFFSIAHDPTTLNRQGNDVGRQYRSAIFYGTDDEKRVAEAYIKQLTDAKVFSHAITTTLEPLKAVYPAEKYHQDYAKLNPNERYIRGVAEPKIEKAKKVVAMEAATQPATK